MTFLALDLLKIGVPLSMICAVLGLIFAFVLIKAVIKLSSGNDRMRQIAGAVEEGAKAYLNRQVITISVIAAVLINECQVGQGTDQALGVRAVSRFFLLNPLDDLLLPLGGGPEPRL